MGRKIWKRRYVMMLNISSIVTKKGNIIGPISKIQAHLSGVRQVLTHYSTWAMVFHPASGKYGIQLKNPKKHDSLGAGRWDIGVGGHNCYIYKHGNYKPMNFTETLIKEADEEIGLDVQVIDSLPKFLTKSKKSKQADGICL